MHRLAVAATTLVVLLVGVAGASATARQGSSLRLVKVVGGLQSPVQVTAAPGVRGTLYVVEQGGLVRVVRSGKLQAQPFLDVRSKVRAGGEQGLLGLAFAPDYATSRQFVVNYTDVNGHTRVVRYRSDGQRALPGSARQLLFVKQPYANHNGGMVAYGKDGLVYVGMGDGGSGGDPENRSQNPSSLLGKMLRLDPARPAQSRRSSLSGSAIPGASRSTARTATSGSAMSARASIEEVDHVAWPWKGTLNFGWDVYEGRSSFESKALGPGTLVQPVAQYSHSRGCSITGGYVYRGSAVPAAVGRYFYGDYCSGTVWSLKLVNGVARQIRVEPFNVKNLTSFGEDNAGELYVVSADGIVYRLTS